MNVDALAPRKGEITVLIGSTEYGEEKARKKVPAILLGDGVIAYHADPAVDKVGPRKWNVTHVPTGRSVAFALEQTQARVFARMVARLAFPASKNMDEVVQKLRACGDVDVVEAMRRIATGDPEAGDKALVMERLSRGRE